MEKNNITYKGWRAVLRAGPQGATVRVSGGPLQFGVTVYRIERDTSAKDLDPGPSQKLWNHSPDGFQWGYGGSGPAQLALALLLDATDDPEKSVRLHQAFKSQFVAGWGDQWEISRSDILLWSIPEDAFDQKQREG